MKLRYILFYGLLGAAFLGASLWVWLSGGKSSKAVRAKYRLGGRMLTIWSLIGIATFSTTGCGVSCYHPAVSCYDIALPSWIVGGNSFKSGDKIIINPPYDITKYDHLEGEIKIYPDPGNADSSQTLQRETLVINENGYFATTVAQTEYHGMAYLYIYGIITGEEASEEMIFEEYVYLNED